MRSDFIIAILVALLFVLAGCTTKIQGDDTEKKDDQTASQEKSTSQGTLTYSGKVLAGKTTPYIEFNEEDYSKALSENKIILLNFYANWCPICKAEEPKAYAAYNELKLENVVAFRVNYKDSQTDSFEESLAQKFQIPYQHTKVIIKDGKQILKTPDSWDKARYIKELNSLA